MSTTTLKHVSASLPVAAGDKPVVGEVNFRKFVSSSSAAFVVRAAAAGFSFVMNVVVTRVLGAHEAGLFFLGQTFLLILAVSARFGLDNVLVKFVSTSRDQGNPAASNGVLFKAASVTAPLALTIAGLTYAFVGLDCWNATESSRIRARASQRRDLRDSVCVLPAVILWPARQ